MTNKVFKSRSAVRNVFGKRGFVPAVPLIITGTAPVLTSLIDGDILSGSVTWGSYSSTAGSISGTTRLMSINGGEFVPYDGLILVSGGNSYRIRELVSDDAGSNPRPFDSALQTIASIADPGEMLLTLESDSLVLSNPQILVVTDGNLFLEAA